MHDTTRDTPALTCPAWGQMNLGMVGLGALGANQVRVRTLFSGISNGTDRWVANGRFLWGALSTPLVPGYQAVGIVEETGSAVSRVQTGQQVFTTTTQDYEGASAGWGAHAGRSIVDEAEVYDATGIDPIRASLTVSAQVGYNAAQRLTLEPGALVVVFGDGIIGASAAQAAVALGYGVAVVGRRDDRLSAIRATGIDVLRDGADLGEALRGLAPDAVIDTVQNDVAFDAYLPALRQDEGQIVYSGHSPDGVTAWADMTRLQQAGVTAHFVSGWTRERIEAVLGLMSTGALRTDALVDTVVATRGEVDELASAVLDGKVRGVAAVIDWSEL